MNIIIGSDHAGYELKLQLISFFSDKYKFTDVGTNSLESCDYPDYAHQVANAVSKNEYEFGILICGSGTGVNITANKHKNVRSALSWIPEIAKLAREHNNANILALPARFISVEEANKIVEVFLSTNFEGGRHLNRVNKIEQ
ncbi:MAG: ribose 5-phosphate isomerase B [Bacteroidota bacterium]